MHTYIPPKRVGSDQAPHEQPQEAWASKTKKASKPPKPSQRSSLAQLNKPKNMSTQLSHLCVRHVIKYCGAYLLDLLEPPATGILGKLSLMVIREAIINGEVKNIYYLPSYPGTYLPTNLLFISYLSTYIVSYLLT